MENLRVNALSVALNQKSPFRGGESDAGSSLNFSGTHEPAEYLSQDFWLSQRHVYHVAVVHPPYSGPVLIRTRAVQEHNVILLLVDKVLVGSTITKIHVPRIEISGESS
jgi:hypothetical protein